MQRFRSAAYLTWHFSVLSKGWHVSWQLAEVKEEVLVQRQVSMAEGVVETWSDWDTYLQSLPPGGSISEPRHSSTSVDIRLIFQNHWYFRYKGCNQELSVCLSVTDKRTCLCSLHILHFHGGLHVSVNCCNISYFPSNMRDSIELLHSTLDTVKSTGEIQTRFWRGEVI